MTYQDIVDALQALPFGERANAAAAAGLTVACCTGCGCYIGSDYCHPVEDAVEWEAIGECVAHCPNTGDEDQAEDDDAA